MHLLQLLYAVTLYPHVTQIYPKTLFSSQRWGEHRSHSSSQAARSRSQFSGQISIPFSSPKSRGHTAGHVGSPRSAASCSARPAKCQHTARSSRAATEEQGCCRASSPCHPELCLAAAGRIWRADRAGKSSHNSTEPKLRIWEDKHALRQTQPAPSERFLRKAGQEQFTRRSSLLRHAQRLQVPESCLSQNGGTAPMRSHATLCMGCLCPSAEQLGSDR